MPSVVEGEYVQRVDGNAIPSHQLASVCICWLRTRPDDTIDFEVVVYPEVIEDGPNGRRRRPADEPMATFPAHAAGVPQGITGQFYEIDTGDLPLPPGNLYLGARWDAAVDQFFFVCVDTSEATLATEAFFRDDRSQEHAWTSVFETSDPIFRRHRSLMVRGVPGSTPIPALGIHGAAGLLLLLAALGVSTLRSFAATASNGVKRPGRRS